MSDVPATTLAETRTALQQVAVHVLARRRHAVTGRFGLRPSAGGLATPAFGDGDGLEVVRTSGRLLVVERGATVTMAPITTLGAAAELVGVELTAGFSVGADTPPMADPSDELGIDDLAARGLGDWWAFGREAIDAAVATSGAVATVAQVWPEHFDLGCSVEVDGDHVNLGASPGDGFSSEPYLYVGPWSAARPGDDGYWNAPFGAVLRRSDLASRADATPTADAARSAAAAFLADGLARFSV